MHTKQINRLSIFVLLGSFALAGCTVTVPENGGYPQPIIQPGPGPQPQPQPWPQPQPQPQPRPQPAPSGPSVELQSQSFYNGRDSSGKRIRAFVARAGKVIRVDSKTGRNFSNSYRYASGNTYRSGRYTITVTSRRSFVWNGPFGRVTMND